MKNPGQTTVGFGHLEDEASPDGLPTEVAVSPARSREAGSFSSAEILGDRYEARELLGRGGMGEVWRAFDLRLRVDVALKSLRRDLKGNPEAAEVLRREVRSAREVISPNVCRIFDLVVADGRELVSMEYVDGITLRDLLKERGPLPLREAAEIASQLLAGLDAIHRAGLVHLDLKPRNVMITPAGRVVVMDLGIARRMAEPGGLVEGTPAYMAPEQARGDRVDPRTDVYASGLVLAEMIGALHVLRPGREQPANPGDSAERRLLASNWFPVLRRATSTDPVDRYPSIQALARALEDVTQRVRGAEDERPYPGLAAFTAENAEFFFGREAEVEAVWRKLAHPCLQAIIGPSGAGKSSLLRAGLLPSLPADWRCIVCQPGDAPLRFLGQALAPLLSDDPESLRQLVRFEEPAVAFAVIGRWRRQQGEALVIVDQFEELFTLNDRETQTRFADLLGRMVLELDVHVLVSLRDDFLLECREQPALAPVFKDLIPIGPPVGLALRRALVQPALRCGYRFEGERLVERMLAEVAEERGALPLLAFAASRLWDMRDRESGILTQEAYERIGGVAGALAMHAEEALEHIGSERIPIVREIFRNLASAQGTRAARDVEELLSVFAPREAAQEVLQKLIDARLLISFDAPHGGRRVEIIHESLLSAWPRLVRWQMQEADGAHLRDQLRQAAHLWDARGRPADLLWTGVSFLELRLWRVRYPGRLTAIEEAFTAAMTKQVSRRKRRQQIALSLAFACLCGIIVAMGALWWRSQEARRQVEASKLIALGRLQLEQNPTAALAYALSSLELADDPDARRFALEALWRGPVALIPYRERLIVLCTAFSPDGRWLAVGGRDGRLDLWSEDGEAPRKLDVGEEHVQWLGFGPRSDVLVTQSAPGNRIRFWSTASGKLLWTSTLEEPAQCLLPPGSGRLLTFTQRGGRFLVQSWPPGPGRPTDLGWTTRVPLAAGLPGPRFAFAEDGGLRAGALHDPAAHLALARPVKQAAFHPKEDLLAFCDTLGEIRFWRLDGLPALLQRTLRGVSGTRSLRFDAAGLRVAAASSDQATRVWDLAGPPAADPLVLRRGEVLEMSDAAFHPSGRWLVTKDPLGIALWPMVHPYPRALRGHQEQVNAIAFAPDGRWLASASVDGTLRIWQMTGDGPPESRIVLDRPGSRFLDLALDPRGRFLFAGGQDGKVVLVPLDGGPARDFPGFAGQVYTVAVDPSGRLVAAAGGAYDPREAVVRLWNLETGKTRVLDAGDGQRITELQFTPGGSLLTGGSGGIRLWNPAGGTYRELLSEPTSRFVVDLAGRTLLSSSQSGAIRVFDLARGGARELADHENRPRPSIPALDSTGGTAITADFTGMIRIGPVSGESPPHLLPGYRGLIFSLAVDPGGRWIAAGCADGTIRLWPLPAGRPFHLRPHAEIVAVLRAQTNLRVVEDKSQAGGYRLEATPFKGWREAPAW